MINKRLKMWLVVVLCSMFGVLRLLKHYNLTAARHAVWKEVRVSVRQMACMLMIFARALVARLATHPYSSE